MLFSEKFKVSKKIVKDYGAVDISLVCDLPLFIDPMLIFNSEKTEYQKLHKGIIRYFHFLYGKASQGLSSSEIDAWFNFSEVPNNWLGYSLDGNKGLALGKKFARFLYNNMPFAVKNNNISQSIHIEKVMLLYDGSGKDKISDLTVNLIKGFLCEYTQEFAKKYINRDYLDVFPVEKVSFNYDTESFISKEFLLPYVYDKEGRKEFVLLTPYDILREEEPSINKKHFIDSYDRVRGAIDNLTLRAYVNNYLAKAVREYEHIHKKNNLTDRTITKIEKEAFEEVAAKHPEIYDYYIRLRESDRDEVCAQSLSEVSKQIEKLCVASTNIISIFQNSGYQVDESDTAREEARNRLRFFKHILEDCDGYKNLYSHGEPIAKENDLQRLFKFVWYDTSYKVDAEVNNGRGSSDFIVSKGAKNQNIVEFKLASNSTLAHVFTQVEIYEKANCSEGSLIAIFFFTEDEYKKAYKIVVEAGCENMINQSVFLIDCRNDNKLSASNPKAC